MSCSSKFVVVDGDSDSSDGSVRAEVVQLRAENAELRRRVDEVGTLLRTALRLPMREPLARIAQNLVRGFAARRATKRMKRAVLVLQASSRMWATTTTIAAAQTAAVRVQARARARVHWHALARARASARSLQTLARRRIAAKSYARARAAILALQANARRRREIVLFATYRAAAIAIQTCARRMMIRLTAIGRVFAQAHYLARAEAELAVLRARLEHTTRDASVQCCFVAVEGRVDAADAAWRRTLDVGAVVDARLMGDQWYDAIVTDIDSGALKVHFRGWSSKWDTWIDRSDHTKLQRLHARTNKWRHYLRAGDFCEVRLEEPFWHEAVVMSRDASKLEFAVRGEVRVMWLKPRHPLVQPNRRFWLAPSSEDLCRLGTHIIDYPYGIAGDASATSVSSSF